MKSVFLVKTPLQLLNAVEAKHYYNLLTAQCIVVLMADRKSQLQLINLANNLSEWGRVIALNDIGLFSKNPLADSKNNKINLASKIMNKSIFYVWRLNKLSRYLGKVDYVFVGYARYIYMKHFVNTTLHNKLVLLDDGNATLLLAKERYESTSIKNISKQYKYKIKNFLKKKLQGVNDADFKKLEFFTIYDIVVKEKDSVVLHDYTYLRQYLGGSNVSTDIYFIGSPISEIGLISQADYLKNLSRVKQYYTNYKLVYIAHRRESALYLDEISKNLDIEVIHYEYPIEYQLLIIGPRPLVLASFISSALDSCSLIFGDEIKITAFKIDVKNINDKENIEDIYNAYKKSKNPNFVVVTDY